ncbi:MAG: histone deacetylase [Acidobacteriota bacterium]|nr:histone deacetylase [Acidobacteriota bacterium]
MVLIGSDRFSDHRPPDGHPEQPARAQVMTEVARRWVDTGGVLTQPRPATRDELMRVHTAAYVDRIADTHGQMRRLDPDTYTSAESYDLARLAAGATVAAVEATVRDGVPAMAFVRPPGHHAETERAMGFCLFNSVAVAAAAARASGIDRVAVIDYDVHHGNGTQWMFYEDATVLYVSLHQYPFYPGTGSVTDVGRGDGLGTTLNVPLAAGASDADYDRAMRELVNPVVAAFAPELILLSAGFDAHSRDPLGGMRVSTEGYAAMTAHVQRLAVECCRGRLAAVTEGGYDLSALDACLTSTLTQLCDGSPAAGEPIEGDTTRIDPVIPVVREALIDHWPDAF